MKLSQLVTLLALFKQERYCFHVWHASLKSNHFEQGSFYLSRKETEWEKARDNHHSTPSLLKSESLCPTRQDHPSWKGLVRFTFGRCFKKQRFLRLAHTSRVIVLGAPQTNPESNKNQLLLHNRYWWDSVSAESALSYLQTVRIWLVSCTKSVYTTYKRLLNVREVSRAV